MKSPNTFNLTAIFVKDTTTHGFTGFFAQFPNIVAEGSSEDETLKNLISLVSECLYSL